MSYIQIDTKRVLVILSLLLVGFMLLVGARSLANNHPAFYANCTEARAHHDTNIPRSSKYYRPQLDRNNDGFACQ